MTTDFFIVDYLSERNVTKNKGARCPFVFIMNNLYLANKEAT